MFLESIEMYRDLFVIAEDFPLAEQFVATLMSVISIICTAPALILLLKLKKEEKESRTEHLFARAVSRTDVMGGYLSISLISSLIMLFLSAFGLWLAGAAVMDEPLALGAVLSSALVYLPAIWVTIGLGTLLIGLIPKVTSIAWFYLGYSFLVIYLGQLLQFPEWMEYITPFGYIPALPIESINYTGALILTIIAIGLMIVGFNTYNRRDIMG